MKLKKIAWVSAAVMAGGMVLYAAAGFWLLPKIATRQLPEVLAERMGVRPQLNALHFNPFTFRLVLEGFALPTTEGQSLLGFAELELELQAVESLRLQGLVLKDLVLRAPQANIQRRADGSFNFDELLRKLQTSNAASEKTEAAPLAFRIHHLAVEAGQAVWSDGTQAEPLTETVSPINLEVSELTTQPDRSATVVLDLEVAAGHLSWRGDINVSSLTSTGQIQIQDLNLAKLWDLFLQPFLPLHITEGKLALDAPYQVRFGDGAVQIALNQSQLTIQDLELVEKTTTDRLIKVPSLVVSGVDVDVAQQQVNIASVVSQDAQIRAWLKPDGQLNYQALFASGQDEPAAPADAGVTPESRAWSVKLGKVAVSNYQLQWADRRQAKPVEMLLSEFECQLENFSSSEHLKLPVHLATRINQDGFLKLSGDLTTQPFVGDWALEWQGIKLKSFQSYLDPFVRLELVDGAFNGRGQLAVQAADEWQVLYRGEVNIDHLLTRDKSKNQDFLTWDDLRLVDMNIDVARQSFKLGKVRVEHPYFRFTIKKDRSTNLDELRVATSAAAAEKPVKTEPRSEPKAEVAPPKPLFSIGKVELNDGKSDFADYSLILPFVAEMNHLNGEVDGFSSDADAVAALSLKGKVYDLAAVSIKGNYQLQSNDSDIALNFSHMPLPLITPYMAEFAGYRIENGQMALDLKYSIKQKQLSAQNKVLIDRLVLGDKVENPKAVSLPLELAIALLKDGDGKIKLDFPISGSLDDPQFSVGALVADVLVNLVSKVATAPFKAIGALFEGDGDPSTVTFAPGTSELLPDEAAKLAQIGKVLGSKPELILEIKGLAYQVQDWPLLRSEVVVEVLKKMKSGELRDQGQQIRSEYIQLSDEDYKRLLAKFYAEVFPQEIEFGLLGKPRLKHDPDADFYRLARLQLEAIMQPEEQRLNGLAIARANGIAKYLGEQVGVDRNRLFILATETQTGSSDMAVNANLSLNVAQ